MNLSRITVRTLTAAVTVAMMIAALRAAYQRHRAWLAQGRYRDVQTNHTFVVGAPRVAVYELLRDPLRLAAALGAPGQVERLDDTRYRWLPDTASASPVVLVEIVGDLPAQVLAWRVSGGILPHEGSIRLDTAHADTTAVRVGLRYRWSHEWAQRAGIPDEALDTAVDDAGRRLRLAFQAEDGYADREH